MIPSILLALTVIVVMIDVLVGIHRGFGFGVVRLIIWIIGSVISALIARSVTVWLLLKWAKVPDMKLFSFDVFSSIVKDNSTGLSTHLSGTFVSFAVPIVFIGLFIVSKFITWLIYCIVKQIIKKIAKRDEAHNAAVDAVKAIHNSDLSEQDGMNQETMIGQPSFDNGQSTDLGSFGAYPKEETVAPGVFIPGPSQPRTSETGPEPVYKPVNENTVTETVPENVDVSVTASQDNTGDEAAAPAGGDGFEALARDLRLQDAVPVVPVKQKKLKKRHSLAILLMKKSVLNSILGGVLGLIVSLFTCAIIFSPISEISKIIAEEKMAEPLVNLVSKAIDIETEQLIDAAFDKDSKPISGLARNFEITSDFSIRAEDFTEAINTREDSIVYYIYKYTGASAVASMIYNKLTPVNVKDIGLENRGIETYNFPDTFRCYLGLVHPTNSLVNHVSKGNSFNIEMIDRFEDFFDFILKEKGKGEILTSSDKTGIVNGLVDRLNEKLEEIPALKENDVIIERFNDYNEAKNGLKDALEMVRRLFRAGVLS